jgi:apolipoprotein D and lipocalin family protein
MKKILCLFLLGLFSCAHIPEGVVAVKGFDAQRYLGTWYEIARIDNSFEKGLEQVAANYSLNKDGSMRIVNRGFDPKSNKWKEAEGKAYFVFGSDTGQLKVTFFWPFYGGYNVIALDEHQYSYALVCGNSKSYLWILARQPELSRMVIASLVQKAKSMGFDADALIFVQQKK